MTPGPSGRKPQAPPRRPGQPIASTAPRGISAGVGDGAGGGEEPGGLGLGRQTVVLSIVLHVVGFFLIVGVPRLMASGPDAGRVYEVDLVTFPGPEGAAPTPSGPPAAAPQEIPKEAPKPPAPKPAPPKKPAEKAIVLPDKTAKQPPKKEPEKPKPAPVKKEEPPAEKASTVSEETASGAAATPQPPSQAPVASVVPGAGTPGGTGAGESGDGSGGGGDAYTFYLALLKRNIESAWKRPVYKDDQTLSATVNLRLSRSGRVLKLEMSKPSGFEPLDRSLMQAVRAAEPFPPFPTALAMDTLPVQIVFDLTPEGADTGD